VRIVTKADAGQWLKATNEYERIIAKAATQAMRDVGKLAVKNARAVMAGAGFSTEFQRMLRVINKPASGYVLNPSEYIHSLVNYADVFETGKTITGSKFLWLPLPNVPPNPGSGVKFGGIVGRAHMTPSQYVRKVGPLYTMRRPGHLPMLGARLETAFTKPTLKKLRRTQARRVTLGESRRSFRLVPMFVAVTSITIPQKFDLKGAFQDAFDQLDEFYAKHLEPYEGRK
jgi:hypothetical protein